MTSRRRAQGISEYLVVLIALALLVVGGTAVLATTIGPKVAQFTLDGSGPAPTQPPPPAPTDAPAPVEAPAGSFTVAADPATGPMAYRFTDTSTGSPTSWAWDFGDGSPASAEQHPVHSFPAGTWTVTMVASNAAGDSAPASATVSVADPAPAAFIWIAMADPLVAPATVTFDDASAGPPTTWAWDFGDGSTASGLGATHTFAAGTWTVTLSVDGPAGPHTATSTVVVLPAAPSVSITASATSGVAPLAVTFGADAAGAAVSDYGWDFESDGTVDDTAASPVHVFDPSGAYTVTLHATVGGVPTTATTVVNALEPAPAAVITASVASGPAPLLVSLGYTSTGGRVTSESWDFGDKTAASTQRSPNHTFSTPGEYTVGLTLSGPGGTRTLTTSIRVVAATAASFTASAAYGPAPLAVSFTDTSAGSPTGWEWAFGDGSTSTQQHPSHTFASGTWTVRLTASGPGGSSAATLRITVVDPIAVVPALGAPSYGGNYATVTYTLSAAATGGDGAYSYAWAGPAPLPSAEASPTVTFACSASARSIAVTVTDGSGLAGDGALTLPACPAAVAVSASKTSGPGATGAVNLSASSSGGTTPRTITWAGPGGWTATGTTASHTFDCAADLPGTVTATVTDARGSTATDTVAIAGCTGVTAAFNASTTTGDGSVTVTFTDASTGSAPTAWEWDFGDGSAHSLAQNPTHTYSGAGSYSVTLTASNAWSQSSLTKTGYIVVASTFVTIAPNYGTCYSNKPGLFDGNTATEQSLTGSGTCTVGFTGGVSAPTTLSGFKAWMVSGTVTLQYRTSDGTWAAAASAATPAGGPGWVTVPMAAATGTGTNAPWRLAGAQGTGAKMGEVVFYQTP